MPSFLPSTVSLLNKLDVNIRNNSNTSIITENTTTSPEYYSEGSRKLSILHSRLRHQCSSLNSDLYRNKVCATQSRWQTTDYNFFVCLIYARTLLKITEYSFILVSSFPKSNVSIFLCGSLKFPENTTTSPEYYSEGSRKLSMLHSRLRHQCSSLNSDLYRINITNDPKCQCGAPYEDSIHYLME
jgi:hypothetical protein